MEQGNQIGKWGEDIATRYLERHGFAIIERNHWKPWGEIDIVAQKNGILHFIEVKTVQARIVGLGTHETRGIRPEENVHPSKLRKLQRVVQTYLSHTKEGAEWKFDVIAVYLDVKEKKASLRFLEDIVL